MNEATHPGIYHQNMQLSKFINPPRAWIFVFCEFCVLQRSDPSSREVLPSVYVILSAFRCNNKPQHLQILGRRSQSKKSILIKYLLIKTRMPSEG